MAVSCKGSENRNIIDNLSTGIDVYNDMHKIRDDRVKVINNGLGLDLFYFHIYERQVCCLLFVRPNELVVYSYSISS